MSVGLHLAGTDNAVKPLRLFDPDGLSQAKEEGFCERLARINRENTIEPDGSRGIGSIHVKNVLSRMTNKGHAALMQIIAQPGLLDYGHAGFDRNLVLTANSFLGRITDGINYLTVQEPYAPALQEFWDIYNQCRIAFPEVFHERRGEPEYI